MRLCLAPLLLLSITIQLPAQLIPNGSFEAGQVACPANQGQLPAPWFQAGLNPGGADLYSTDCNTAGGLDASAWAHFAGLPGAAEGLRFAAAWSLPQPSEAIGTGLASTLTPGTHYVLSGAFAVGSVHTGVDPYDFHLAPQQNSWRTAGTAIGQLGNFARHDAWTYDSIGFLAPNAFSADFLVLDPGNSGSNYLACDDLVLKATRFGRVGAGLPGANGPVLLSGSGSVLPATTVTYTVSNAAPNTIGALGFSFTRADYPLFGGLLVPSLSLGSVYLAIDGSGNASFSLTWIPALAGLKLYNQAWLFDPNPVGLAASAGLVTFG